MVFPTRWQAVLWRNWGIVPAEKLCSILQCSMQELTDAAQELGLPAVPPAGDRWLKSCYLTIIRNNWHLLPYSQLLQLLDWTPEQLFRSLMEEDFLWLKLGRNKPDCPTVRLTALSEKELSETQQISELLKQHFPSGIPGRKEKAFAFLHELPEETPVVCREDFTFNFIAPYSASCGDIFNEEDPLPDVLLERYAAMGIQGIWIHAVLYHFVPIPGAESYSGNWQDRRQKLRALAEKCQKYGLKIYLYLNEPRSLDLPFFDLKPEWAGLELPELNTRTICTTRSSEPLQWLEHAVREVWKSVPSLGGAFCITMSENPTNCHYRAHSADCPYCRNVHPAQIIADVLKAMERGMHSVSPEAKLIASTWSWQPVSRIVPDIPADTAFAGEIMSRLPRSVHIAAVSENSLELNIGGVKLRLGDYSISQVGPSEKSKALWKKARECGLPVVAKVQLNNSWELAAVPYIPVPYLIFEHLQNLKKEGISGLMLSWTHGGYPGGNLELLRATPEELAAKRFSPDNAEKVCKAWRQFSEAFRQFPFCKDMLYTGPANRGPSNRFYKEPTLRRATMLYFPVDDLKTWRGYYPENVFEQQFSLLLDGWKEGMKTLEKIVPQSSDENVHFQELKQVAEASACHFESVLRQIRFVLAREQQDISVMRELLTEEIETVKKLLSLVSQDSRLGFEASNHYFYSLNDLLEKIISCCFILQELPVSSAEEK
jgi:hypothetical protein